MCDVSCDPFKYWESADISLTVQDRDIVAMEHYRMAPLLLFETFLTPIPHET